MDMLVILRISTKVMPLAPKDDGNGENIRLYIVAIGNNFYKIRNRYLICMLDSSNGKSVLTLIIRIAFCLRRACILFFFTFMEETRTKT